jgi:predicted DsbA family dithiol-disulfide isomerase
MRVDLWTDIVCPWCYIGMTRFDRALARFDGDVEVVLHPFQLDPEAPVPGVPAVERYAKKFGDDAPQILARVTEEARNEGLTFDFERAITGNTFDAHRALTFARDYGKERELERSLYRAYFSDGVDVSDRAAIARRASDLGLDENEILRRLEGDDGVDEMRRELASAFDFGITAVPSFVFAREFLVPGAVDADTFLKILEQLRDVA